MASNLFGRGINTGRTAQDIKTEQDRAKADDSRRQRAAAAAAVTAARSAASDETR